MYAIRSYYDRTFNSSNGQREMMFYIPEINYNEKILNDLPSLSEMDPGKLVEMGISFDKSYSLEEVKSMLPEGLKQVWYWVDTYNNKDRYRITSYNVCYTKLLRIQGLLDISEQAEWSGLPAGTKIGHVHFHVGDLNRARQFYTEVLGFDIVAHYGQDALFISAGGYHHHIGLNIWAGVGAPPNPEDATGLRYFTITLPDQSYNFV